MIEQRFLEAYETNLHIIDDNKWVYVPLIEVDESTDQDLFTAEFISITGFVSHQLSIMSASCNKGFPPGFWYMCTVTTKSGSDKDTVMLIHKNVLEFFDTKKIEVYAAALEKSSIWHIHYIVKLPSFVKNEARDLGKVTGTRVRFEKKVRNLKMWNGLCKYVYKREYIKEKTDTCVEMLIDRIEYQEGHGYQIKST